MAEALENSIWALISPNGDIFEAESPIKCCKKERESRVPAELALKRIISFLKSCDLCGESEYEYILGEGTTAELHVCSTCKNTIFAQIKEA